MFSCTLCNPEKTLKRTISISAPTPGPKPRAVRGAKRTKKTEQALKLIENKNALVRQPTHQTNKRNRMNIVEPSSTILDKVEVEDDTFEIKVN